MRCLGWLLSVVAGSVVLAADPINPVPRLVVRTAPVAAWEFQQGVEGWVAENDCSVSAVAGHLVVQSAGDDPFFHCPLVVAGGQLVLTMKARCQTAGKGVVYWATKDAPRGEDKTSRFRLVHDGQWRTYETRFIVDGQLTDLRIDPGGAPGECEIDWIRLARESPHPLTIENVQTGATAVRFDVVNHSASPVDFRALGQEREVAANAQVTLQSPVRGDRPLETVRLEVLHSGLPPVTRTVFVHNVGAETDWVRRSLQDSSLLVARDGSLARITRGDELVAILGPLVHFDGVVPALQLVAADGSLRFEGDGVSVTLAAADSEIAVSIDSQLPCTGPVVRVVGNLEQGLFAGLEYLGRGEASSSQLDIEIEEHLRFAPDPLNVTMPLMAFVTDQASVGLTWSDMQLYPEYATPNFFDATADHRLALRGKKIEATIHVGQGQLEELIVWAVKRHGLPPLPRPPRSAEEQWSLCLRAIDGPLKTAAGWGHCAEPRWPRRPYADIASTIWRLTGRVPELETLTPGGAHVDNEAIYFVTGRADEWLDYQSRRIQGILSQQRSDGSFRYDGKYRRGHFEDTASGVCARPAADLLEYARVTGDPIALEAAVRTLDYMRRFRTPRGAQTWEVPLHTPDLLASAYLVWAYTRGFELTGNQAYLLEARKWALSGVPFVYLWSRYPIMAYATPPVYGATNWQAPVWIGLPVQWVGGVYAYALTMFAPYDNTLDWQHLARGILTAAEQMQYPDGPYAGLLPDAFVLEDQQRLPARINPSALVSLRLALGGQVDSLSVATNGTHRVAAPYPVRIDRGYAQIRAQRGVTYQILVDGKRIEEVESKGNDTLPLE